MNNIERKQAVDSLKEICQIIGCSGLDPDMCHNHPHICSIIRTLYTNEMSGICSAHKEFMPGCPQCEAGREKKCRFESDEGCTALACFSDESCRGRGIDGKPKYREKV